jgi:signal transduction histidine kinase
MDDDGNTATQRVRHGTDRQHDDMAHMAGGFAHNFNNLLAVISGNLQLVEMRLHDAALKSLLREAALACEMGARMTERLLTYGQRRRLDPVVSHVNDILHAMESVVRQAAGSGTSVVLTLDPEVACVLIDRSEFEGAILNLVLNARDAMPGGGELEIMTQQFDLPAGVESPHHLISGCHVRVSVRDTGSGMAPDVVRRAFEPFFSTKDSDRGTGLGLATVLGFAGQSGGTAVLHSAPGRGTAVHLYLPVHAVSGDKLTSA